MRNNRDPLFFGDENVWVTAGAETTFHRKNLKWTKAMFSDAIVPKRNETEKSSSGGNTI